MYKCIYIYIWVQSRIYILGWYIIWMVTHRISRCGPCPRLAGYTLIYLNLIYEASHVDHRLLGVTIVKNSDKQILNHPIPSHVDRLTSTYSRLNFQNKQTTTEPGHQKVSAARRRGRPPAQRIARGITRWFCRVFSVVLKYPMYNFISGIIMAITCLNGMSYQEVLGYGSCRVPRFPGRGFITRGITCESFCRWPAHLRHIADFSQLLSQWRPKYAGW